MLALAFLVCTLLAERDGRLLKKPVWVPPQGAVWTLLGALCGAKVFWILQYSEPKYLYHAFFLWEAGYVYYGGLLGGFAGAAIYCYIIDNFDLRIADVCAPFLALGQGIVRIGCFLNGCCHGGVCEAPWGVQFPRGSYAWDVHIEAGLIESNVQRSLAVHPTQLYMTIGLVAICLMLRWSVKRSPFTFAVFLQYMFLYGILRGVGEIFRGDPAPLILGLRASQTMSIFLIVAALVVYPILHMRSQRLRVEEAATQEDEPGQPEEEPAPAESS